MFYRLSILLFFYLPIEQASAATITQGIDEQARLPYWELRTEAISVRLVQRLPDQTRGYFMARGFTAKQSEIIAQSCVFQTIIRNISTKSNPVTVKYDLSEWEVVQDNKATSLKLRDDWAKQWNKMGIADSQKIAFEWSLMPTRQVYEAEDYNWGMSVYNLPPGEKFDLTLTWQQSGETRSAMIKQVECAPDFHPEPPAE